jgi:NAD(P)-dependent dehydrogenase (short-subunit alcohol dehydrogenase family)
MSASLAASALFRVDGIVAAITGGGTGKSSASLLRLFSRLTAKVGIGLIMAKALAANGAKKVYILGRRLEVLETAAKETPGLVPVQCDVTSKDSIQAAVDKIASDTGYVHLLIANSGVMGPPASWGADKSIPEMRRSLFTDNSIEDFTEAYRVNVAGALFTMAAFLELLDAGNKNALAGGYGGGAAAPGGAVPAIQSQVIITSSIAAFVRGGSTPPSYGGSKAAIMQIAKQASSQLAPHGIRVNAFAPGCKCSSGACVARVPDHLCLSRES